MIDQVIIPGGQPVGPAPTFQVAEIDELVDVIFEYMTSIVIAISRMLGIIIIFPLFTRVELGFLIRTGIALSLVLPVLFMVHQDRLAFAATVEANSATMSQLLWMALVLKELLIGALLGIFMSLPFWAIQAVGEIIDSQLGITIPPTEDPTTLSQVSAISGLIVFLALVIFVSSGGFHILLTAIYGSYTVWPVAMWFPNLNLSGFVEFGGGLDNIFKFAMIAAGPFLIVFLLTDIGFGYINRFSGRISSYSLATLIKSITFASLFIIYITFLTGYMRDHIALSRNGLDFLSLLINADEFQSSDARL